MFRGRPLWLWFTAMATIVYLVVEFAFNARLLDVIGSDATAAELDDIQHRGRIISGFAVAIGLWPLLIKSFKRIATPAAATATLWFATGGIVFGVYIAEEHLIESIAESASASQKAKAPDLELLQRAIKNGSVNLAGIDTSSESEPATKAFFALFPILALHIPELEGVIAPDKEEIARRELIRQYGHEQGAYDAYIQSLREIKGQWNRYAKASNDFFDVTEGSSAEQARLWAEYRKQLKDRGLTPNTVSRGVESKVRRDVQARGIRVPDDWKPSDRSAFNKAVTEKITADAHAAFISGMSRVDPSFGAIPPGLRLRKFADLDVIQSKWRSQLGYPANVKLVAHEREPEKVQFRHEIFEKVISARLSESKEILDAPEEAFDIGGKYDELGKSYVTKLVAPVIALTFSFLGAIVHVFKLGGLIAQLVVINPIPAWKKLGAVAGAAAVVVLSFSFVISTSITRSELYGDLHQVLARGTEGQGANVSDAAIATLVRGAINAQPVLYAIARPLPRSLAGD